MSGSRANVGIRTIGFDECFTSLSPEATVDVLDRAAVMSRWGRAAPASGDSHGAAAFPAAQFSAMSGDSLMFGHMGLVPGLGMCVKTGMQVPDNRNRGLDTVQASVLLFDADTGVPQALLDGRAITIMRTAGALVAGIRKALEVDDAMAGDARRRKVAVIGYGAQGRHVARLARAVLKADQVDAFNRSACAAEPGVQMTNSVAEAVADADVIACATSSSEPVVDLAQLLSSRTTLSEANPAVVIGSLNSYEPTLTEIDPAIIAASTSVHIDVPDPQKFGPIAQAGSGSDGRHSERQGNRPRISLIGDPPDCESTEPECGQRSLRTVLIGGHGLQDALLAFAVLHGWPAADAATRRYTDTTGEWAQRQEDR
ncbi:hypothetical protein [Brevibacterium sp.]|uniref:hypothetical protein n=1 Tax=Brevibacterium sp. TaxID=1701 RepID=UPI002812198F|nr:hypothetical protein [Brevibacterium sp.]